jgi:DNA-binding PadR family transcriptional regulator
MYRFDILDRVIELAVLGLLREQDLHGYELRKRITQLVGVRAAISYGSLYPALARLEAAGAVKAVEAHRGRTIPMTGSLSGEASAFLARRRAADARSARGRKVYGITDDGREQLVDLIEDPSTDDRVFPLKVAFCSALPSAGRLELFERRRAQLAGQLGGDRSGRRRDRASASKTAASNGGASERIDRYLRALREHDTETIQHEIAWLDRLIADEQAPAPEIPPGAPIQEDTQQ